jgi:O-antigen/teichoic acid export membrane protein
VGARLRYSLGNHFSLLLWNAPPLVYPLVIVTVLGAEANAHFYINWMIANMLLIVPTAVSTSAFAQAANRAKVNERAFWRTMRLTLAALHPPALALIVSRGLLLRVFGPEYATAGRSLFTLLVISVFPYTVNTFVIVDYRIRRHVRGVMWVSAFIALLSLALVSVFGTLYALPGIGMGWMGGQTLGSVFALLHHRHTTHTAKRPCEHSRFEYSETTGA